MGREISHSQQQKCQGRAAARIMTLVTPWLDGGEGGHQAPRHEPQEGEEGGGQMVVLVEVVGGRAGGQGGGEGQEAVGEEGAALVLFCVFFRMRDL